MEGKNKSKAKGGSSGIPKLNKLLGQIFGGQNISSCVNPGDGYVLLDEEPAAQLVTLNQETAVLDNEPPVQLVTMNQEAAVVLDNEAEPAQLVTLNQEEVVLNKKPEPVQLVPLSLGIEIGKGVMHVIVPRNTRIPTRIEKTFITRRDNQRFVTLSIYEGERALVAGNNLLGSIAIDGFPPMRAGVPRMKICFEVGADGTLVVSAMEEHTGISDRIRISICNDKRSLSEEEIHRMVAEALKFRSEDEAAKEKLVARSNLENYATNMKGRAQAITKSVQDVEEWLVKNDSVETEKMQAKLKQLQLECDQSLN